MPYDYGADGFVNWHSTFPTVLMALTYKVSGGVFAFTVVQATLICVAMYGALRAVIHPPAAVGWVVAFMALPFNAFHLALHMPDALLLAGLMALTGLLAFRDAIERRYGVALYLSVVFALLIICVWVRPNAAIIAPVVAWFCVDGFKRRMAAMVAALALCVTVLNLWDRMLMVNKFDVSSVAMGAEIAGISKLSGGRTCIDCLDFVGNTANARANFNAIDVNGLLWSGDDGGLPSFKIGLREHASEVRQLWLQSIIAEPVVYLKIKAQQATALLGFDGPLFFGSPPETGDPRTADMCGCDVRQHAVIWAANRTYGAASELLGRPWLLFLLFALALRFVPGTTPRVALIAYWLALAYYAGFLIQMQRVEFRYFYPSWGLLCLVFATTMHRTLLCKLHVANSGFKQGESQPSRGR
ncbi:hypothetical protein [Achromobacter sp.]|uniref:hypothetical protein n=1 Tax=Achromobacter sp. TaxID=134375 RepID=UPI00289DD674|nr:hypothetical protein [Achromobacter sp.]